MTKITCPTTYYCTKNLDYSYKGYKIRYSGKPIKQTDTHWFVVMPDAVIKVDKTTKEGVEFDFFTD